MKFTEKDLNLLNVVSEAISKKQIDGDEDFTVSISKKEIRDKTGRTVLRDVVMNRYAQVFSHPDAGLNATVKGERVVIDVRAGWQTKFTSVDSLVASTKDDDE